MKSGSAKKQDVLSSCYGVLIVSGSSVSTHCINNVSQVGHMVLPPPFVSF